MVRGCTLANYVDYEAQYYARFSLLKRAYTRSRIEKNSDFNEFVKKEAYWLEDYALYMAIKDDYRGASFSDWS